MKATPEDVAKNDGERDARDSVRASMKATPEDVAKNNGRGAGRVEGTPAASMKATPEDVAKMLA